MGSRAKVTLMPSVPKSSLVPAVMLLCVAGAACACRTSSSSRAATTPPKPYMRLVESTNNVAMQLVAREFRPAKGGGPSIWLAGVSHLGESNYFARVQKFLDDKALVLFEGIGFEEYSGKAAGTESASKTDTSSAHSGLQTKLAESLGMAFQLEAMDYSRPNFKNSDVSLLELRQLMEKASGKDDVASGSLEGLLSAMQGGEGAAQAMMNFGLGLVGSSPKLRAYAKLALLEMLASLEGDISRLGAVEPGIKPLLEALIERRNEKVMADLRRELATKKRGESIAILYGAGHMADLERRVRKIGYSPGNEAWFTAMSVETGPEGVSPAERDLVRRMIRSQFSPLTVPSH